MTVIPRGGESTPDASGVRYDDGLVYGDRTVNKKMIVMTAAAALLSFAGTFVAGWLTGGPGPAAARASVDANTPDEGIITPNEPLANDLLATVAGVDGNGLLEKKLKNLVFEVRERIQDLEARKQELDLREQRIQSAQETLDADASELAKLRVEVAATVATLRSEREKLAQSRVAVSKQEKANLMTIAATYDKMDPAGAAAIFSSMTKNQAGSPTDAVKILYYMTERTKGKVLGELAGTEPQLAAYFSQRLKQVSETQ
ncbi:MAG TPA: hypothetical protein ENN81_11960 [Phycisphaerales bacterium]|nr:hypothetical protein [Phycisphaerales bacterium]